VADLAEEFSVRSEFEELGCGGSVGRTSGVAAGKDEDMAFGVDRDAHGFAKVEIGGEFQEIGDSAITDFGRLRLLSEKRNG
jgi:hypothetical protein